MQLVLGEASCVSDADQKKKKKKKKEKPFQAHQKQTMLSTNTL